MSGENRVSDQELMVSLNTVSDPILTSKSQFRRDFQVSYWKEIVPKDNLEIASTRPWIVVHTASDSSLSFDQQDQFGMRRNGHSENENLPPGDKGSFCGWDKPLSFIQMELSPEYLRRVTAELGISKLNPSHDVQVSHTREPKILLVGQWLLEELMRGSEIGNPYVDSLANLLALQILLRSGTSVEPLPYYDPSLPVSQDVARAIEYMQAHFNQDISLADLSHILHSSPSQLGRLFKRYKNLTPHQYLILLRVAHARELLLSSMLMITEAASQSGFVDQSHLNRHFKRIYGVTPKTILNGR